MGHEAAAKLVTGDKLHNQVVQLAVLLPQRRARDEHRVH
jgi:methyl coenzyme M reductase alpha subunit